MQPELGIVYDRDRSRAACANGGSGRGRLRDCIAQHLHVSGSAVYFGPFTLISGAYRYRLQPLFVKL